MMLSGEVLGPLGVKYFVDTQQGDIGRLVFAPSGISLRLCEKSNCAR